MKTASHLPIGAEVERTSGGTSCRAFERAPQASSPHHVPDAVAFPPIQLVLLQQRRQRRRESAVFHTLAVLLFFLLVLALLLIHGGFVP